MSRVRATFLTVAVFSLTTTWIVADEKPEALEPLQIIEDCIKAAEAGDFARFVDHLSEDEQKLQAGYILKMTQSMSASYSPDQGAGGIADPTVFLMTRTLNDLVKEHIVPASPHGTPNGPYGNPLAYPMPTVPSQYSSQVKSDAEYRWSVVGVLSDTRRFLIAALTEFARPTQVSGEDALETSSFVNVGETIKLAKSFKWTLYTRGDYALAVAIKTKAVKPNGPTSALPTHVEFKRINGRWMITRLLPVSMLRPTTRMATRNPFMSR
jgi:hypothetical protein